MGSLLQADKAAAVVVDAAVGDDWGGRIFLPVPVERGERVRSVTIETLLAEEFAVVG